MDLSSTQGALYTVSVFFILHFTYAPNAPPAYGPELNSSKTEFLLIGLSKQLATINNSSLTTTHSARNLGFIFDEHLTFSDQISSSDLSPNLAIIIFVSFAVSVHTSIQKQLPPSPLPLFAPSLTTATLFITTCPSLRSPGSNSPELSCMCCCQSSQIQSHHSHPPVSALVKHN